MLHNGTQKLRELQALVAAKRKLAVAAVQMLIERNQMMACGLQWKPKLEFSAMCRQQSRLKQEAEALDSDGAALLADTQVLHDSTQELRELQALIAAERKSAAAAVQQAAVASAALDAKQEEVQSRLEQVGAVDRELEELRVALTEKRAAVSAENVKVRYLWTCMCF